jgi:hypothetical protein
MTSKYQQKQSNKNNTSLAGSAPVAGKAKKGPPNRKQAKRLAIRVHAWINPEYSKSRFAQSKAEGGAKCPGSMQ